jgi:2Fe-2S iron-sulfur cluster binding domain
MTTFRRTATGGLVNRLKPIGFTYNGKTLSALEGDTVASALLANNQTVIARSFKYHRARGFLSAGIEEPNGLFTLNEVHTRCPMSLAPQPH